MTTYFNSFSKLPKSNLLCLTAAIFTPNLCPKKPTYNTTVRFAVRTPSLGYSWIIWTSTLIRNNAFRKALYLHSVSPSLPRSPLELSPGGWDSPLVDCSGIYTHCSIFPTKYFLFFGIKRVVLFFYFHDWLLTLATIKQIWSRSLGCENCALNDMQLITVGCSGMQWDAVGCSGAT